MDRREFVSALTVVAGGAAAGLVPSADLIAEAAPPTPTGSTVPATNIQIRTSYPPLPPLGADVFRRRLERAQRLTRDAGATVLVATSGATNFAYLVGADFGRSERMIALLLPVDGEPVIVAPAFETERVRRGSKVGSVRGWEEYESPYALAADALGAARAGAVLLLEPKTEYWTAMKLTAALPGARLVDGSGVFEALRLVKSAEEIARMRRAIEITEDAVAATHDQLRAGMADTDIEEILKKEHVTRGVRGDGLVQLGPQSALPHGGTVNAILRDGMVVLIDAGCAFQGYVSDITRTRWFGSEPPPKFRLVYDTVYDAQSAAMEKVKPGVPAQEIDRAARAVISKAGFGAYFTHRLGHGMGMDGHEPTWMVEGNSKPLEAGFVFSVEPGIYIPNEFGVRLEDDFMCTEDGGALLSRRAPRI
ncbi:MAG: Xaa-Pro peptidase family protein [Gemmatimonadota bacterium]|nr:Xaa-Pro peptidase family protein [Gemmatimonadota bacterium]